MSSEQLKKKKNGFKASLCDISTSKVHYFLYLLENLRRILWDVHQQPVIEQLALNCYSRRNIARYYCCYESQTCLENCDAVDGNASDP